MSNRIDFNEFYFDGNGISPREQKILNIKPYKADKDLFKINDECLTHTTHNFVGLDFNLKCLEIIKALHIMISYESEFTGDILAKEINKILKMNLV